MKAIWVMIRADILSRPLQTVAILALTFLTGAMATGSLTVLTRANEPYDVAAERLVGPHLLFTWDAASVNPGDQVRVRLAKGNLNTRVETVENS